MLRGSRQLVTRKSGVSPACYEEAGDFQTISTCPDGLATSPTSPRGSYGETGPSGIWAKTDRNTDCYVAIMLAVVVSCMINVVLFLQQTVCTCTMLRLRTQVLIPACQHIHQLHKSTAITPRLLLLLLLLLLRTLMVHRVQLLVCW